MSLVHLFKDKINDVNVNVRTMQEADSGVVNIFLHGYLAVNNQSALDKYYNSFAHFKNATNILLQWDSGNTGAALAKSLFSSFGARDIIGSLIPGGAFLKVGAFATISGKAFYDYFVENEKKADKLSQSFEELLKLILKDKKYSKINLVGHSLGGRIIVNGLALYKEISSYPLDKIILMAAAVEWPSSGLSILTEKNITLYNFYAETDMTLALKPDLEKSIGRHGIPEQSENIKNIHCTKFGHTEYWPNLVKLLSYTGFNDMNTQEYNLNLFEKCSMQSIHFAEEDIDLFPLLENTDEDTLCMFGGILFKKAKDKLSEIEKNPRYITRQIQLEGGNFAKNITRGYGVSYATIINDIASSLKIPLEEEVANLEETSLENSGENNDKSLPISESQSIFSKLKRKSSVDMQKNTIKRNKTLLELEKEIVNYITVTTNLVSKDNKIIDCIVKLHALRIGEKNNKISLY